MDTLGIDIGTVSVKYLRYRGGKEKGSVVSMGDFPYKGDFDHLRTILAEIGAKEGTDLRVSIGLTSQDVMKKTFTVPVLPKGELKEALDWAATKIVSTALETMVYEYIMLGQIQERDLTKEEVFFVGLETDYARRILSSMESAGFKEIVCLTDIAFAFRGLIGKPDNGSTAVVDIGGRQTGIYIFHANKLMSAREIMTASESFDDALMSGFGFTYEEAAEYKTGRGFNEESLNVLLLPLERLTGEIHRTFNVYGQKYPEKPVSRVLFTGRGSRVPNLLKTLSEYFNEELGYLSVPKNVTEEYLPAYGLCLGKESLVNLLPPEIKTRQRAKVYGRWARISLVAILAVLVIVSMDMWSAYYKAGAALKIEQSTSAGKKAEVQRFSDGAVGPDQREILAAALQIERKDLTLPNLMRYLSSRLPRDVYLTEFLFEKSMMPQAPVQDAQMRAAGGQGTTAKETVAPAVPEGIQGKGSTQVDIAGTPYLLTLKGYVFGGLDTAEPAFLNMRVAFEESGFLSNMEVMNKQIKEVHGRLAIEFVITARCVPHET